ncbi:MAG: TlpA family protein disulfide reductase [Bacteroidales bacterium]
MNKTLIALLIIACSTSKGFATQPESTRIIILDTKNTLGEQLKQFEGKLVYLDAWSTWCSPCIREFAFAKELQEFFNKNDIVILYLCIDRANSKERWRGMLQEHSPGGYHVFIDPSALDDYKKGFGLSRRNLRHFGKGFPWYIIIGKNGEVLVDRAFRPSSRGVLLEQLGKHL